MAKSENPGWKETSPGQWTSVLAGNIWTLGQTDDKIIYRVYEKGYNGPSLPLPDPQETKSKIEMKRDASNQGCDKLLKKSSIKQEIHTSDNVNINLQLIDSDNSSSKYSVVLKNYFQLGVNLEDLYGHWSASDPHFKAVAADFTGVRILRQDPVENLFAFICSSNNNISRISGMVENLCKTYGEKVGILDKEPYFTFPSIEALTGRQVEQTLRELGFGYRAKYISETAKYIVTNHSVEWLYSLRGKSYQDAHGELLKLCGVGAKVADCVCLMSLDKAEAIPVDTHVWQIAIRDYNIPKLNSNKTMTDATYKQIGDFFRGLWGPYAGWAHSVLFSADLKKFQDRKVETKGHDKKVSTSRKRGTKAEVQPRNHKEKKRIKQEPT
ncbi:N-glycosylase/DNA lyase isoform X2 [Lingula anatina]|uniref:N-glycosylase/DNA lyase n=1 Tax=Lingula anatina TaxID=7574 RepID=A0A1S3HJU6_LINAN|nr:N-glycosylase/DNA lyase isoform X2 [Lingula anatina]|eukprot:XP_013386395.1 N-glycosylase/DNA lyase isoform X2 [Lingula anatina]